MSSSSGGAVPAAKDKAEKIIDALLLLTVEDD